IPGHPDDILTASAGGLQHVGDILQGLPSLPAELVGVEALVAVPADHAGDEQHAPLGDHAVGIALGAGPALRQDGLRFRFLVHFTSFSNSRAMISCCTSVAPS